MNRPSLRKNRRKSWNRLMSEVTPRRLSVSQGLTLTFIPAGISREKLIETCKSIDRKKAELYNNKKTVKARPVSATTKNIEKRMMNNSCAFTP